MKVRAFLVAMICLLIPIYYAILYYTIKMLFPLLSGESLHGSTISLICIIFIFIWASIYEN